MPTYINLINFTDRGVANYRETIDRARDYWTQIEQAGGRVHQEFWTMGAYDIVVIFEAPDDETATRLALQVSALGNVRTSTTRAFTTDEMSSILERAG